VFAFHRCGRSNIPASKRLNDEGYEITAKVNSLMMNAVANTDFDPPSL
jgi:hypothetical protein